MTTPAQPLTDAELDALRSMLDHEVWRLPVMASMRELSARLLVTIERMREERRLDLADVDRFRRMARQYQDERDALRERVAKLERVAAEARTSRQYSRDLHDATYGSMEEHHAAANADAADERLDAAIAALDATPPAPVPATTTDKE